jgi:hypothetical protein
MGLSPSGKWKKAHNTFPCCPEVYMQFLVSDWRTLLALFGGVALVLAAYRGHLFSLDVFRGKAETKEPRRKQTKK